MPKQCKAFEYLEVYGLDAMCSTLEEELHADEVWINLPGPAVWVLHAGGFIWKSKWEWGGPVIEDGVPKGYGAGYGGALWN